MDFQFFMTSIVLGIGLAMDACAVSMTNGLRENKMNIRKILFISFMFGLFQGFMPFIGYLVGCQFINYIEGVLPWIALGILGFLGIKMIIDAIKCETTGECEFVPLVFKVILIQAVATSIDALSVGLTIADYKMIEAFVCSLIIMIITFIICIGAHYIGKKFGDKLGKNAELVGGIVLTLIGIEIFITGMFF